MSAAGPPFLHRFIFRTMSCIKYRYFPKTWLLALACWWSYSCQPRVQAQNPCDPQPPCLPAMSQPFGFCLDWKPRSADGAEAGLMPFQLQVAENPESPANFELALRRLDQDGRFQASFLAPERLNWLSPNTFQAFLAQGEAGLLPLIMEVKEEISDCCPQFIVAKILLDGRKLRRAKEGACFVFQVKRKGCR